MNAAKSDHNPNKTGYVDKMRRVYGLADSEVFSHFCWLQLFMHCFQSLGSDSVPTTSRYSNHSPINYFLPKNAIPTPRSHELHDHVGHSAAGFGLRPSVMEMLMRNGTPPSQQPRSPSLSSTARFNEPKNGIMRVKLQSQTGSKAGTPRTPNRRKGVEDDEEIDNLLKWADELSLDNILK